MHCYTDACSTYPLAANTSIEYQRSAQGCDQLAFLPVVEPLPGGETRCTMDRSRAGRSGVRSGVRGAGARAGGGGRLRVHRRGAGAGAHHEPRTCSTILRPLRVLSPVRTLHRHSYPSQ